MKQFNFLLLGVVLIVFTFNSIAQTPVAINGQLQLKGNQLCNKYGNPVQLRGMSSHGLQWFGDCINSSSIDALKNDWGADVIRLAMYVEEGGYKNDPAGWRNTVKQKSDAIIAAGLYVIIDWHILADKDPRTNQTLAEGFFEYFSNLYANVPNVIYEICNEPNSDFADEWTTAIKPYAEDIIPIIRNHSPNAIILVGTPKWSSKVGDVLNNPLTGDNAKNVLYSFHFYAGSHFTQAYVNEYSDQVPIFANEWGTSSYSGDGLFNPTNADVWLDLFAGNNKGKQVISWCNWSYSDKYEVSAALVGGSCGSNWNNTSASGTYVKGKMSTPDNFIVGTVTSPKIIINPFKATTSLGLNAKFSVYAIGDDLTYQWKKNGTSITGATSSELLLTNVSTADVASYTVVVSNQFGSVTSKAASLAIDSQKPKGEPFAIPGVIEFEDFDTGGEGVAFHDLTSSVGIGTITDSSDYIKSIEDNEWIEYTVTAATSGSYKLKYHMQNNQNFPKFYFALDGEKMTQIFKAPVTNYTWKEITDPSMAYVPAGKHILRIIFENGGDIQLDRVEFMEVDCNGDEGGTAYIDACSKCVGGNTGIEPSPDSDNDGTPDCKDECPNDPDKLAPGICGCGTAEGECKDCANVWGGTAQIDGCGVCAGGTTGIIPDVTCLDCANVPNGTAKMDKCGVCAGGTTGVIPDASCTDCTGKLFGTAFIDDCNKCVGGTTGLVANASCSDCLGVPNGTAQKDVCGVCNGNGSSCVGTLTPYKGIPHTIPGKIQGEFYNAGGAEIAYHDSDAGNSGNVFRTSEGVDIATEGTGLCIGWIADKEWVKYTVNVTFTGKYDLDIYCGGVGDANTMTIKIGTKTFTVNVANTNSYSLMETVKKIGVDLVAGEQIMTITFNGSGFNLDYIDFIPQAIPDCNGVFGGTAYLDHCGICVGGNTGKTASVDTDGDGVYDCDDLCPNNPDKILPGNCGCDLAENECPDCNGVNGGTASIDECGVCSGGTTGIIANSTCKDCKGVIDGTASIDLCGVCSGGTTGITPNTSCKDCAGVINGTASIDDCDICTGGNTGITPNSTCVVCPGGDNPDECGVCGGNGSTCTTTQLPYMNMIRIVTNEIQAEDYDTGGQGKGFSDSETQHQGSSNYRTDAVDLDTEGSNNHSIAYVVDKEYLVYTLTVVHTGNYTAKFKFSTPDAGKSMDLLIDNVLKIDNLAVPVTGGYHTFTTISKTGIALTAGVHVFKVLLNGDGFNFDSFTFTPEFTIDCHGDVNGTAFIDNCSKCVGGNTGEEACGNISINLEAGWNFISLYSIPNSAETISILDNIKTKLHVIKTDVGYYMPSLNPMFNTLPEMQVGKGYFVYMNSAATLNISGTKVLSKTVSLKKGWNVVGYPLDTKKSISTLVSPIATKIETIKNFDGFWIPNNATNSIIEFIPGKGYLIKVNTDCTISF